MKKLSVRYWLTLVFVLCGASQVWSQSEAECKSLVARAYNKLNAYGKLPDENQMCVLEYGQHTTMRDSSVYRNSTIVVKMKANKDKVWYDNGEIELFQDRTTSVVILRNREIMYLRDSDSRSEQEQKVLLQKMTNNNDTLLSTATVEKCVVHKEGSRKIQSITLLPDPRIQKTTQVQRLIYTIDVADEIIRSIQTDYTAESKIAAITMDFHVATCDEQGEPFETSVYERFFDSRNKLEEPYQHYKLTDIRVRKDPE